MDTSSPRLKDVLRLAGCEPYTWLGNEPGADPQIQWVATSLESAQPGDLLALPAADLSPEAAQRAKTAGVAALVVIGDQPYPADRLPSDLPVVAIRRPEDLRAFQRSVLGILLNQRTALMERGVRIFAQLSQIVAQGEGLEGLARAMADISGRGVLVQDKRLGVLAQHPSATLAAIWDDVLQSMLAPELLPAALRDRKRAGEQTHIVFQDIPGGLVRLVIPVIVSEVARGYLSLVGVSDELDALDHLVIEQGALVCAIEMSRLKAVREAEKRLKGDLLTAILQDDLAPRDARLWVQTMGLDLRQMHVALRFAWDSPSAPSRRRLETLVNGEVYRNGLKVIVSPMGSEVICFCQVPRGVARPDVALALGEAVYEQGRHEHPDIPIRCGVGSPAEHLGAWRTSFRQAGQALEMARRIGERKPLFFPDLSVYRLLLQIEHSPELSAFQEETLGALLAQEGSAELIRTLEAYFEHNGNLTQTADALFIHRNTLSYRLERIAQVGKLDLDLPATRLAVQLALHINRMMGSK
ncbi:MAG TPA: helix-turn-helix domain-containing protein [Anaerolineales bacterium]|nr:helix-turn-helix domain-containing protein [Anaerolineales bacterium]